MKLQANIHSDKERKLKTKHSKGSPCCSFLLQCIFILTPLAALAVHHGLLSRLISSLSGFGLEGAIVKPVCKKVCKLGLLTASLVGKQGRLGLLNGKMLRSLSTKGKDPGRVIIRPSCLKHCS
jgi:hypothetical protein